MTRRASKICSNNARVSLAVCVFVTAQPNRTALIHSTYLGGGSVDIANAVATDPLGNVYIAGQAVSSNFPVTAGAYQLQNAGTPSQLFLMGMGQVTSCVYSPRHDTRR